MRADGSHICVPSVGIVRLGRQDVAPAASGSAHVSRCIFVLPVAALTSVFSIAKFDTRPFDVLQATVRRGPQSAGVLVCHKQKQQQSHWYSVQSQTEQGHFVERR